jgi:hypothetical protein
MIVPFVTGGTLDSKLAEWREHKIELNSETRLQYALDMARGLRDLHNIDDDGIPSATHGDLKEQQYLFGEDGRLLLGDFNKGLSSISIPRMLEICCKTLQTPSSSFHSQDNFYPSLPSPAKPVLTNLHLLPTMTKYFAHPKNITIYNKLQPLTYTR